MTIRLSKESNPLQQEWCWARIILMKITQQLLLLVNIVLVPLFSNSTFAASLKEIGYSDMYIIATHPKTVELLQATRSDSIYVDEKPNYFLAFASKCSLRAKFKRSENGSANIELSRVRCGASSEMKHVSPLPKTWKCTASGAGQRPMCFRALRRF